MEKFQVNTYCIVCERENDFWSVEIFQNGINHLNKIGRGFKLTYYQNVMSILNKAIECFIW